MRRQGALVWIAPPPHAEVCISDARSEVQNPSTAAKKKPFAQANGFFS